MTSNNPFFLVLVKKSLSIMSFEILNSLHFENENCFDVSLKQSCNSLGIFGRKKKMIYSCVGDIEIVEGT
jgi:hypothetical protein